MPHSFSTQDKSSIKSVDLQSRSDEVTIEIENTYRVSFGIKVPGNALRMLVDIARIAERFNKRSQSRAW